MARSSRTLATITSCPISCSCSLIQIECVPASIATRAGGKIGKPLLDCLGTGPEAATTDHLPFLVERAVMAPDISKVDSDRHLNLGLSAWDFRNGVLRWLLHGNSLLLRRTCSSHFPVLICASFLKS